MDGTWTLRETSKVAAAIPPPQWRQIDQKHGDASGFGREVVGAVNFSRGFGAIAQHQQTLPTLHNSSRIGESEKVN
jgi:hypothetical protein